MFEVFNEVTDEKVSKSLEDRGGFSYENVRDRGRSGNKKEKRRKIV